MNRSIYIIKPEAMSARMAIRERIIGSGLNIVRDSEVIIPNSILDSLYLDLNSSLREATRLFMGCEPCEVGEVAAENAVSRLLAICGTFTDPSKCEPQTIRWMYGLRQAERIRGELYFKNAIHRPKTNEEAQRDLKLFYAILNKGAPESQVAVN